MKGDTYLFIDNIEYVKNWGSILKYSCKYQRHITVFVAVKNSNKYMNDDLREILGYHCEIEVFPFSYKEYLEYYKINPNPKINNLNEKELFEEYQQYGGLPEVLETEDISYKYQIINWAYENTRNQNIYKLYFISFAKSLTKRLIETTGETFSTKIFQKFVNQDSWGQYDMFDLSYDLLLHYYSIITSMDIIKRCGNIDLVGDKFIMDEYKHYVSDPSFFALCRYSQINSKEMLESIIYMEFLRRNFNVARGIINNEEITFVHNNFILK